MLKSLSAHRETLTGVTELQCAVKRDAAATAGRPVSLTAYPPGWLGSKLLPNPFLGPGGSPTNSPKSAPVRAVRTTIIAAAALAVICLVALSARDAAGGSGSGSPRAGNGAGARIDWGPCKPRGPRLQCARVRVPLDWDHPNGRKIQLALIRYLASKPKRRIGSIFFNPGGPAESGVELVQGNGASTRRLGWGPV
jgi:hypothetical protein